MVSTRPLIMEWIVHLLALSLREKSYLKTKAKKDRPCINPLMNVLSEPITIGITVIFIFYCFFSIL